MDINSTITEDVTDLLNKEAFLTPDHVADLLKSKLDKIDDSIIREQLLTEVKCFEFFFRNGYLKPILEYTDKEGKNISYPDLQGFSDVEIVYLKERVQAVKHPFPKSRYSHLLWLITKHRSFGQAAVDSYRELAFLYLQQTAADGGVYYNFCQVLHCYHLIAVSIKDSTQRCKEDIINFLKSEQLPIGWKDNVLQLILESSLFKQNDLKGYTSYMISLYDHLIDSELNHVRETYLKTCLQLAQKEGVSSKEIYSLLAEHELRQFEGRKDETGMLLISAYQRAAYYYKMAGNEKKYAEAMGLYTSQKSKLNLSLFQHEFSPEAVKILNDEYNGIVERMFSSEHNPFYYLVYNKGLLMSKEKLEKRANEEMKNSLLYLCNVQVYDNNNNAKSLDTEEEKLAHRQSESFSFHLQLTTLPILEKFFYKGIKSGIITRNTALHFFNNTWFVQAIAEFTSETDAHTFSWIEMIGPSVYDLVAQIEAQILTNNNYPPNYILCIDSLSIKIEGIIRDLGRLAGVPVTKIKEGEALEMNLEELLRNESICGLFTEEDILLFRYLLTKHGWNIRNNISHSFYRPSDYTRQKAMLLLLAIFRLCKYGNIVQHKSEN